MILWYVTCFLLVGCVFVLLFCLSKYKKKLFKKKNQHLHALIENKFLKDALKRRSARLDVMTQSMNDAVLRLNKSSGVLMMNDQAKAIFSSNDSLAFPQAMQFFYRNNEWLNALSHALKELPKTVSMPDVELGGKTFSARVVTLGKKQALLFLFDTSHEKKLVQEQQQFLQNLMHDMKTPLTSILGYVSVMRDFNDDVEIREESLDAIRLASQQLNGLLESLLTLDAIKHQPLGDETCSALQVWKSVHQQSKALLEKYDMTIHENISNDLADVQMANQDLSRVMSNIVENAIYHASSGKKMDVSLSVDDGICVFSIRDYGYGLSDPDRARVSERFFKASESRTTHASGHGLGLSIVKETMEKYGTQFKLENKDPQGLLVCIGIPMVEHRSS